MIIHSKRNKFINKQQDLDYKDIDMLRHFITDQGKILSRRSTGLNVKQQKKITKYIKRARILSLLPFLNKG